MQIEIYSDTVCPWCFVGKKRLELAASQRPELALDISWLPFELNPDMSEQGVAREAYLASKFGDVERLQGIQQHLVAVGSDLGIDFHFERSRRMPNSRASHALLTFAGRSSRQSEVGDALFKAYFEEGLDIGDHDVLISIAKACGLDPQEFERALASRRDYDSIIRLEHQAHEWGISGVPTFIFDRRYAVSGAQEPEVFLQVFDRVSREAERAQ